MGANKEKQNIRMKKVCERLASKVTYSGLSDLEKKYVKTVMKYRQKTKDLDNFYKYCKRTETGQVDWDSMSKEELDNFDYIYKQAEILYNRKTNMENDIDGDSVMNKFMQINNRSINY